MRIFSWISLLLLTAFGFVFACNNVRALRSSPPPGEGSAEHSAIETLAKYATEFTHENKRLQRLSAIPTIGRGMFPKMYPCDKGSQAKSWDEVTIEEKMLVHGYEILTDEGESFTPLPRLVNPVGTVGSWMIYFYKIFGREPENREELLSWVINESRKHTKNGGDDLDEGLEWMYQSLISPVTGKQLEWDHRNFSPGNAFVTVLNSNDRALEGWMGGVSSITWEGKISEDDSAYEHYFVYSRVYGKTGVLKETVIHVPFKVKNEEGSSGAN